jgi:DNA (cytosine-5)-methyltransferase 1
VTVERLPTPAARDWKSGKSKRDYGNARPLSEAVSGALNPAWVCWLMGWPSGWDSVEPLTADPETWTGSPEQWAEEPADVPRVATGIPDRVARLRMLGNGWVPQCAMWVAGRIAWALARAEAGGGPDTERGE